MQEGRSVEPDPADAFLFTNGHGRQMTRFGVRYLLRKYVAAASRSVTTLREKRIHPHSVRHSTAVALLNAGVDFATISQWLGHASLNTTLRYARADLNLKRQALSQVFPDALAPTAGISSAGCGECNWKVDGRPTASLVILTLWKAAPLPPKPPRSQQQGCVSIGSNGPAHSATSARLSRS
jgi:hypothetical protein